MFMFPRTTVIFIIGFISLNSKTLEIKFTKFVFYIKRLTNSTCFPNLLMLMHMETYMYSCKLTGMFNRELPH
jgi:hypothetical protein